MVLVEYVEIEAVVNMPLPGPPDERASTAHEVWTQMGMRSSERHPPDSKPRQTFELQWGSPLCTLTSDSVDFGLRRWRGSGIQC